MWDGEWIEGGTRRMENERKKKDPDWTEARKRERARGVQVVVVGDSTAQPQQGQLPPYYDSLYYL